jgi:hypothetical protein
VLVDFAVTWVAVAAESAVTMVEAAVVLVESALDLAIAKGPQ